MISIAPMAIPFIYLLLERWPWISFSAWPRNNVLQNSEGRRSRGRSTDRRPVHGVQVIEQPGQAIPRSADLIHSVDAKHSVAFGLRLVEPLIAGALVWESLIRSLIGGNIRRLIAQHDRFDIQQNSIFQRLIQS